jgi:hypothetical protein
MVGSMKMAFTLLSNLIFCGLFLVLLSGCEGAVSKGQSITPIAKLEKPSLDIISHSSVETAYFALG